MKKDTESASSDSTDRYDHKAVAAKWQKRWEEIRLDETDISYGKKPFYNLMMFPYPSAEGLHVGNMYAFTGSDIYGRFKRMQGYTVFEPIGLDGFGIHSENYALKVGRHPMEHAKITEKNFYHQLRTIGAMFDWSRTVETYDPDYYRWTQWLFVQMFKHGLAYRSKASVNWCPGCKTVLADEQVIDGKCERCGNIAEKRLLEQWFFRITAYAEKLLQNSFSLDWSEKVRVAQQNWIGKKEGINIAYDVVDEDGNKQGTLDCFTTRPDTNFGATFVVIAPEHPFVASLLRVNPSSEKVGTENRVVPDPKRIEEMSRYVEETKNQSEADRIAQGRKKTGAFTGLYCVNNLNGRKMPLYISDFVIMGFGTGAVVGVPGHDKRDFEFAEAFDLPVIRVVVGQNGDTSEIATLEQVQEEEGTMVSSEFLNGMDIHDATKKMMDYLEDKGWGKRVKTYHLRDWLISRQRYWGPPIPMIYCEACAKEGKSWFTTEEVKEYIDDIGGWPACQRLNAAMAGRYPVPEDQLPVELPYIGDYKPGDDGVAPLAKHKEFYHTTCPGCGGPARRETDVSDTFLDSSWYFLRYPSVHRSADSVLSVIPAKAGISDGIPCQAGDDDDGSLPWDPAITKKWLPVHMYTGGAEHSVLHLLYSRFVTMALHDFGYIDFEEPFTRFFAHGLVIKDGAKMSKSKGNVINPDEYIDRYGCDALRMYLMFMGPFDQGGDFRDSAMEGMSRWIGRIWRMALSSFKSQTLMSNEEIKRSLQKLIQKVTDDLEKRRYNTAIASMMEFTNFVQDKGGLLGRDELKNFLLLLAPFAPYVTEELYQQLEHSSQKQQVLGDENAVKSIQSVHFTSWPTYDQHALQEESVMVLVQVNGKLREKLEFNPSESRDQKRVEESAKESQNVQKFLQGTITNVIFVPGRLINFVVR